MTDRQIIYIVIGHVCSDTVVVRIYTCFIFNGFVTDENY